MRLAHQLGLRTPPTLCGNDRGDILRFARQHSQTGIIIKSLYPMNWFDGQEQYYLPTTALPVEAKSFTGDRIDLPLLDAPGQERGRYFLIGHTMICRVWPQAKAPIPVQAVRPNMAVTHFKNRLANIRTSFGEIGGGPIGRPPLSVSS